MNRSTEEIRQLQARVYGRDGSGSKADLDRLTELTAMLYAGREHPTDPAATLASVAPMAPVSETDDTRDVEVVGRRSFLASRPIVVSAFLFTLCGGIAGGLAVAAAMPAEPLRVMVPPNADNYQWDSVLYYGEINGVQVWTAKLAEDGRDCMVAMDNAGGGAGTCVEGEAKTLSIDLSTTEGAKSGPVVTMDFSDPHARPIVDSSLTEDRSSG